MGGIVGERLPQWVSDQVTVRQAIQGKALDGVRRSSTDLNYLNNRDAWLKMASGVFLENKSSNPDSLSEFGEGILYPMKYVLFNGRTGYTNPDRNTGQITSTTDTFSEGEMASGIGKHGAYDTWDQKNSVPEFGVVPMPGIISCDVKNKNRGSIREANVKIKAHNKQQFTLIEEIYLRLGYDMIIEWGWNQYIDNDGNYQLMDTTLIEEQWFGKEDVDYLYWLVEIEKMRKRYNGNYGGFFGKVSNFKWDFQPDGSYDIQIKLISHGDVVESLRTVPPNGFVGYSSRVQISDFYLNNVIQDTRILKYLELPKGPEGNAAGDDAMEDFPKDEICFSFGQIEQAQDEVYGDVDNLDDDEKEYHEEKSVTSYLMDLSPIKDRITEHIYNLIVIGYGINNEEMYAKGKTEWYEDLLAAAAGIFIGFLIGSVLMPLGLGYLAGPAAGVFVYNALYDWMFDPESTYFQLKECGWKPIADPTLKDHYVGFGNGNKKGKVLGKVFYGGINENRKTPAGQTLSYENHNNYDAFFLYYHPKDDTPDDAKTPDFDPLEMRTYIRLGYILDFIANEGICKNENTGNPIVNIETGPIPMYVPKDTNLTLSYNPHNIIMSSHKHNWDVLYEDDTKPKNSKGNYPIKKLKHKYETKWVFWGLNGGIKEVEGIRYVDARNIYLRGEYILDQIPIAANDTNEMRIDLHGFLKNICQDINQAFGGINNLEPMLDEDTNTLYMMDSTNFPERDKLFKALGIKIPDPAKEATFELFAYKGTDPNVSNFMRDVNITTKISKEMATMITVGATAKGSAPSTDSTAFSRFNSGKINRFASNWTNPKSEKNLKKEAAEKFYKNSIRKIIQAGLQGPELEAAQKAALKVTKEIAGGTKPDLTLAVPQAFSLSCLKNSAAMYGFAGGLVDKQITWARMDKDISTEYAGEGNTQIDDEIDLEKVDDGEYGRWGHPKYPLWRISEKASSKNMRTLREVYALHEAIKYRDSKNGGSPSIGFIPFEMSMTADGISGIKIYNGIKTDTQFLPHNYPKTLEFITKGVDHKISNNDWVTTITTIAVPRTVDAEDTNQDIDVNTADYGTNEYTPTPPENTEDGGPGGGDGEIIYDPTGNSDLKDLNDQLKCDEASYNKIKNAVLNNTFLITGHKYVDGKYTKRNAYSKGSKLVNDKGEWNDNEPQIVVIRNAKLNKNHISNNPTADLLVLCYINKDGNKCVAKWGFNCNTYTPRANRIKFPQQLRNAYDVGLYEVYSDKRNRNENRGNALIQQARQAKEKIKSTNGRPGTNGLKDETGNIQYYKKNIPAKWEGIEIGSYGMHIHRGYNYGVNFWSQGCFTFANKNDHQSFFQHLTLHKGATSQKLIGNNGATCTTNVVPSQRKNSNGSIMADSNKWKNFPKVAYNGKKGKNINSYQHTSSPGCFTVTCIYSDQIS